MTSIEKSRMCAYANDLNTVEQKICVVCPSV